MRPNVYKGRVHQRPAGVLGDVDPSLGAYVDYQPSPGMGLGRAFGVDVEAPPPVPPAPLPEPAQMPPYTSPGVILALELVGLVSTAGLAFHGYRRNKSLGWAFAWALFGGMVPIISWPVAIAQGFGKPKTMTPNRSRGRRLRRNGRRRSSRRRSRR